jgi:hypothetical protein
MINFRGGVDPLDHSGRKVCKYRPVYRGAKRETGPNYLAGFLFNPGCAISKIKKTKIINHNFL